MTVISLTAPGVPTLTLTRTAGWAVRRFEWTPAMLRPVVYNRPAASGTIDRTFLHGAAQVTIGARLMAGFGPFEPRVRWMRSFARGALRPVLTIDYEDGTPPVEARLAQVVVTSPFDAATHRDVVFQAQVPYGIMESVETHVAIAQASATGDELGFTFDVEFDLVFPPSDPRGAVEVVNAGDREAWPTFRMYGPWSGESVLSNETTGDELVIDETVTAGNFLQVDTRERTILLNGDPDNSRYDRLVFPASTWWPLVPGPQRVRFSPGSFTAPAQTHIFWKDALG